MNKQELIEKLKSKKEQGPFKNDYVVGINAGLEKAIRTIEENVESEKPVLSKWVDDSFKMHKNRSIRKVIRNVMADTRRGELYQTVCPNESRLEKIIALAFITGDYDIEKEPSFVIRYGKYFYQDSIVDGKEMYQPTFTSNKEKAHKFAEHVAEEFVVKFGGVIEEVEE